MKGSLRGRGPKERPPKGRGWPAHRPPLATAPAACPARTRRLAHRPATRTFGASFHASRRVRGGMRGGVFSTLFVAALVGQVLPGCAPRSLNASSRAERMLAYLADGDTRSIACQCLAASERPRTRRPRAAHLHLRNRTLDACPVS